MERQHVTIRIARIRLVPDALAGAQLDRPRVAESAHAAQRAEVMIERTILLHHDDNVFDVPEGAGPLIGRNRKRALDARGKCAGSGGCRQKLKKGTAVCAHVGFTLFGSPVRQSLGQLNPELLQPYDCQIAIV